MTLPALRGPALALTVAASAALAHGQTCTPEWRPAFGSRNGPSAYVDLAQVVDTGTGPTLVVGGPFESVDSVGASYLAAFDGQSWSAFGDLVFGTDVDDVEVFDAGSGPELYACGRIVPGTGSALPIARWDGATWSGLGLAAGQPTTVRDMVVFDDGSGPALYVIGEVYPSGGSVIEGLARWDGSGWSQPLDGTLQPSNLQQIFVFDDGAGPALYITGLLATYVSDATGVINSRQLMKVVLPHVVPAAVGAGFAVADAVHDVAVFDDGSGAALYLAYGTWTDSSDQSADGIRRFDGMQWSEVGGGLGGLGIRALASYDSASGPRLAACGVLSDPAGPGFQGVATFDGAAWTELDGGVSGGWGPPLVLASGDLGQGQRLFVGGPPTAAGGVAAPYLAQHGAAGWAPLKQPAETLHEGVDSLIEFDGALFAGGIFDTAGGAVAPSIARWDGSSWSGVGEGLTADLPFASVDCLAVHDDGAGPALYAGGSFDASGATALANIARFDGSQWQPLGAGLETLFPPLFSSQPVVLALASFDDGSGPALYAGGFFATAGGVPALGIARWDGVVWSAVGSGVSTDMFGQPDDVECLAVFDDGVHGPNLYAGGRFTSMGGVAGTARIARWDGSQWHPVSSSSTQLTAGVVTALEVVDEGSGPVLLIGGGVRMGATDHQLLRWDGVALTVDPGEGDLVANGSGAVSAIAQYDDGAGFGPRVFVGTFDVSFGGGGPSRMLHARTGPSSLELIPSVYRGNPRALLVHDDGTEDGPSLFVGGWLVPVDAGDAPNLGRFGGCSLGEVGSGYCTAQVNSTGASARTTAFGSTEAARDQFTLGAEGLPAGATCMFLTSLAPGVAQPPNSEGTLCLGGAIGRFNQSAQIVSADAAGEVNLVVSLGALPQPASLRPALAGETWRFQVWHRDLNPAPTSNFGLPVAVEFR